MQEVNGGEPLSVLTDDVRTAIMKNITRRMTPQPLKIRADIDMTCFAYDGVLHIQASLPAHSVLPAVDTITICIAIAICNRYTTQRPLLTSQFNMKSNVAAEEL